MHEYYSEAIVLDSEPVGETHFKFYLFTKRYGRISARGISARKITSKLSPHLQIGNVSAVRVVEKNGLRVVDALCKAKLPHVPGDLARFNMLIHDGEADEELWRALLVKNLSWKRILALLGWDPQHAKCHICGNAPEFFLIQKQEFLCRGCSSKYPASAVISL